MSTNPSPSLELGGCDTVLPLSQGQAEAAPSTTSESQAARAESTQKSGKRMILAGAIITIVGVVLYCVASFAAGVDADLGDILFREAEPFAGATLGVLGLGTLVWLVGSFTYLRGAMDAETDGGEQPPA